MGDGCRHSEHRHSLDIQIRTLPYSECRGNRRCIRHRVGTTRCSPTPSHRRLLLHLPSTELRGRCPSQTGHTEQVAPRFLALRRVFPHLVAGPIVRASLFLPQLEHERRPTAAQFENGALLFVFGLFQKVVVADALLSPVADAVFAKGVQPDMIAAWCGTFAFTGQIFCDFAGYTSAAIGIAAMLGFTLNENFNKPYGATTFSEFWHRWHISLSTWLRDYLYFPLGGSRLGKVRTYLNIMAVMLLGGLWHGASWTFVLWGGLNGLFLTLERALHAEAAPSGLLARTSRWVLTILGVAIARVFFRSDDFNSAINVFRGLIGLTPHDGALRLESARVLTAIVVTFTVIAAHRFAPDMTVEKMAARNSRPILASALALCFVSFVVLARPDRAFIYFQF